MKALAQRVERARADVAVDDAERAEREQAETARHARDGQAGGRGVGAGQRRRDDGEELPDSRRQTPVKDGITSLQSACEVS